MDFKVFTVLLAACVLAGVQAKPLQIKGPLAALFCKEKVLRGGLLDSLEELQKTFKGEQKLAKLLEYLKNIPIKSKRVVDELRTLATKKLLTEDDRKSLVAIKYRLEWLLSRLDLLIPCDFDENPQILDFKAAVNKWAESVMEIVAEILKEHPQSKLIYNFIFKVPEMSSDKSFDNEGQPNALFSYEKVLQDEMFNALKEMQNKFKDEQEFAKFLVRAEGVPEETSVVVGILQKISEEKSLKEDERESLVLIEKTHVPSKMEWGKDIPARFQGDPRVLKFEASLNRWAEEVRAIATKILKRHPESN